MDANRLATRIAHVDDTPTPRASMYFMSERGLCVVTVMSDYTTRMSIGGGEPVVLECPPEPPAKWWVDEYALIEAWRPTKTTAPVLKNRGPQSHRKWPVRR